MINFQTFSKIFDSSFWRTLSNSLVPYAPGERPQNKKQFLEQLFNDIRKRHYTASVPRDYIVYNKHNYVTRIVPTFSYRDACVYFFCIKRLEESIAVNRVKGTFGGWRLGNSIRKKEEESADMLFPQQAIIALCGLSIGGIIKNMLINTVCSKSLITF
jgi:hypothetical protein